MATSILTNFTVAHYSQFGWAKREQHDLLKILLAQTAPNTHKNGAQASKSRREQCIAR